MQSPRRGIPGGGFSVSAWGVAGAVYRAQLRIELEGAYPSRRFESCTPRCFYPLRMRPSSSFERVRTTAATIFSGVSGIGSSSERGGLPRPRFSVTATIVRTPSVVSGSVARPQGFDNTLYRYFTCSLGRRAEFPWLRVNCYIIPKINRSPPHRRSRAEPAPVQAGAGTHPRSLPQIMWQRRIPRPFSYPYVAFAKPW